MDFSLARNRANCSRLILFQLHQQVDVLLHLPVVRKRMIFAAHAQHGRLEAAGDFERGDARGIGLQRQRDQVVEDRNIVDQAARPPAPACRASAWESRPSGGAVRDPVSTSRTEVKYSSSFARSPWIQLALERIRVGAHRIENGSLQAEAILHLIAIGAAVVDEQLAEQLARPLDRRDARAAARPAHHAAAVQAVLGADRQRGKARHAADRLGRALIEGDVALGHALGVDRAHAAEIGVDGEVAALHAVIEAGEHA